MKNKEKSPMEMTIDERMKSGINHHGEKRTARRTISKKQLRQERALARK